MNHTLLILMYKATMFVAIVQSLSHVQLFGNPFQYSCLENPMDRGAWWVTVNRVTKSWTGLK